MIAGLDSRFLIDSAATEALGEGLAAVLRAGDVVCLWGGLGAGKTTLARGAIRGWTGVDEEAPSPTYTLVQTYDGARGELWHMDLFRLRNADEAIELGVEDAFASAVCLIEWPERLGALAPRDRLDIHLEPHEDGRIARLEPHGVWKDRSLEF